MRNIILILFFLISIPLKATNYYVATDGSNSDPGTFAEPFLTITYAESILSDNVGGDTIFLRVGTYNERVMFYHSSGTAGNPYVVMPYNNEAVIIDGTGIDIGSAIPFT